MSESEFQELKRLIGDIDRKTNETNDHIDKLEQTINTQFKEFDIRIDTYQKASQQVVNLAFGLILTATIAIVVPVIFK